MGHPSPLTEGTQVEIVAYMDVDLPTDLRALLPLVAPLLSGHSDVAIGSRLALLPLVADRSWLFDKTIRGSAR